MREKTSGYIVITADRSFLSYIGDLWKHRELFLFLAWREILVRYKQTVLGVAWAVLRPLLTMIIFSVVFGRIANLPSGGVPYPLLVFSGMLSWQFFADTFFYGSNSLINNEQLISKIYFPRMIIPTSNVLCFLLDFLMSTIVFMGMLLYYLLIPSITIIFLPLFLLWNIIFSISITLFVSALNVRYRDFRYIVPFVVQLSMYVSPVGFTSEIVPSKWRLLFALNPLVSIIDGFRFAFFKTKLYMPGIAVSLMVTIALFIISMVYFRKTEGTFADVI